jgi:hypothetical protein
MTTTVASDLTTYGWSSTTNQTASRSRAANGLNEPMHHLGMACPARKRLGWGGSGTHFEQIGGCRQTTQKARRGGPLVSSGGGIRTRDLRVMSPTTRLVDNRISKALSD